jgi:hypothetical protein
MDSETYGFNPASRTMIRILQAGGCNAAKRLQAIAGEFHL